MTLINTNRPATFRVPALGIARAPASKLQTVIATFTTNRTYDVYIDGVIDWNAIGVYTLTKSVHFYPDTYGSGFKLRGGSYIFVGSYAWSPSNRGTALTANIPINGLFMEIPSGMTLVEGDVVSLSSDDILPDTINHDSGGMKPMEVCVIDYIDGTKAWFTSPTAFAYTTANNLRALKETTLVRNVGFHDLSFYSGNVHNSTDLWLQVDGCQDFWFEGNTFEEPAPGQMQLRYAINANVCNNLWRQGLFYSAEVNGYSVTGLYTNKVLIADNKSNGWFHEWFTTSGVSSGTVRYAGAKGIRLERNHLTSTARNAYFACGVSSHSEGADILIKDNYIELGGLASSGSYVGIDVRAKNSVIDGNYVLCQSPVQTGASSASIGIMLQGNSAQVSNNKIRGCYKGIESFNQTNKTGNLGSHKIFNNVITQNDNAGIHLTSEHINSEIYNNHISVNRGLGSNPAHIKLEPTGCKIYNNIMPKTTSITHSSMYTDLAASNIDFIGNINKGYGSTSLGFGGSTASANNTAFLSTNFEDA